MSSSKMSSRDIAFTQTLITNNINSFINITINILITYKIKDGKDRE